MLKNLKKRKREKREEKKNGKKSFKAAHTTYKISTRAIYKNIKKPSCEQQQQNPENFLDENGALANK